MSERGPAALVPFAQPLAAYKAQRGEIDAAIARVMASGTYILGQEVDAFEREFADYLGADAVIGVASGTDAVELALRGCGIGAGDVVYAPAHTAVATIVGIERTGATPVLVDIDPLTYTLDPGSLEDAIRCRPHGMQGGRGAVVVVHLYGCPANVRAIADIARRNDLVLVEDCAQAHGATVDGRRVGTWGDAAAFSFYPTKNLAAFGDGGAVAVNDPVIGARIRLLREYGWKAREISIVPGINSRLDQLQAAILRVRLRRLEAENAARAQVAEMYDRELGGLPITRPAVPMGTVPVHHLYVVATPDRDDLRAHLEQCGVLAKIHYPVPVHLQPTFRGRICLGGPVPMALAVSRRVLSLPLYSYIPTVDVHTTISAIRAWRPASIRRALTGSSPTLTSGRGSPVRPART